MTPTRVFILLAFAAVLGVPFLARPGGQGRSDARATRLVVVTPHVRQIRDEFGNAFIRWHARRFPGEPPVVIDWRAPGGTTEIIKQLHAMYEAAVADGRVQPDGSMAPGSIPFDVVFGGGSFDHGRLKQGDGVMRRAPATPETPEPKPLALPMSIPMGFSQAELDEWFGSNAIGAQTLYDSQQYWVGTALSSFGIVYNRDRLAALGLKPPTSFADMADPRLQGEIALADPRQSGSITTSLDAILSKEGWQRGWVLLREMGANARYFTTASSKPPIDVSQGEAAMGLAIDFYGRGQAQAIQRRGEAPEQVRVGYVDPKGAVYVDADPISILRGGPNPDLAKRFVQFCLTEEGQALWQFRPRGEAGSADVKDGEGQTLGPERAALRRMPARRIMYERYRAHLIDQVDPFELASTTKPAGWRSAIGLMMGAFAIDTAPELRRAWAALNRAASTPNFPTPVLEEMRREFYSFPPTTLVDPRTHPKFKDLPDAAKALIDPARGTGRASLKTFDDVARAIQNQPEALPADTRTAVVALLEAPRQFEFTPENYAIIRGAWRDAAFEARCRIEYTEFFRQAYIRVVAAERRGRAEIASSGKALTGTSR